MKQTNKVGFLAARRPPSVNLAANIDVDWQRILWSLWIKLGSAWGFGCSLTGSAYIHWVLYRSTPHAASPGMAPMPSSFEAGQGWARMLPCNACVIICRRLWRRRVGREPLRSRSSWPRMKLWSVHAKQSNVSGALPWRFMVLKHSCAAMIRKQLFYFLCWFQFRLFRAVLLLFKENMTPKAQNRAKCNLFGLVLFEIYFQQTWCPQPIYKLIIYIYTSHIQYYRPESLHRWPCLSSWTLC